MSFSWNSAAASTSAITGTPIEPGIYNFIIRVESGGYSDEVEVQLKVIYYKVTTFASVAAPTGVAVDALGNVYTAESANHIIRKIAPNGNITTLAGSGYKDAKGYGGFADGSAATARFNWPAGLALDSIGNLFVADMGNNKIRKISTSGNVTTLAGSGSAYYADGNGVLASFNHPQGVAVDVNGNVYVADENNSLIRKVTTSGNVTTLPRGIESYFYHPKGVAVNNNEDIFVADTDNSLMRKMIKNANFNILALTERIYGPEAVCIDASGNLYVSDTGYNRICKIAPTGKVSTIAGSGSEGFLNGDYADGSGADARFNRPQGIAVDVNGNIYVADYNNNKIRKITPSP